MKILKFEVVLHKVFTVGVEEGIAEKVVTVFSPKFFFKRNTETSKWDLRIAYIEFRWNK